VGVTPTDAERFASWASKAGGMKLSMPTEAEWEFAARAGGRMLIHATPTGAVSGNLANIVGTGGRDTFEYTAPAGSFPANFAGIRDMSGNVWEWTRDGYGEDGYSRHEVRDPRIQAFLDKPRVKRGGSFALPGAASRCANRGFGREPMNDIGFRLVAR
jgi:formylglycine-generating enzyme required for sulfatase activity